MQNHLAASHGVEMDTNSISDLFRTHQNMTHGAMGHQHGGQANMEEPTPEEITLWEDYDYVLTAEDTLFLKSYRDIPQSHRNEMPAGSFAGRDKSFPIEKCEDVRAAWIRVNTAGSANYGKATLYANIKRIAKAKGFTKCLPKTAQAKVAAMEGGDMEITRLAEVVGMQNETDESKILERVQRLADFFLAHKDEVKPEPDKTFEEQYPERAKEMAELTRRLAESDADKHIDTWLSRGLPPKLVDEVKAFMLGDATIKLDDGNEKPVSLISVLDRLTETGLVPVVQSEKERHTFDDPSAEWDAKIKEYQEKHPDASYRDAVKAVARENKELAETRLKSVHKTGSE
jgi:hypothetical protein